MPSNANVNNISFHLLFLFYYVSSNMNVDLLFLTYAAPGIVHDAKYLYHRRFTGSMHVHSV